ncbi:omega-amidase NIT2-like [Bradysia coprophila]|uniref:omega-amidase NIT2-like n=1 Tax=Bradysia coprophila TaxID=38358 RepID=UPI00187DA659|nr:omega-amidase NIT2-like [Bradysia coprophila]
MTKFGMCLIQNFSGTDKTQNENRAMDLIRRAVQKYRPRLVALPECFNAPYINEAFEPNAELVPTGSTCMKMSSIAKELGIYLVGGIMERDPKNPKTIYNTATVWGPDGNLITKHRKVHLYDFYGAVGFKESATLTPGNDITTFMIDDVKVGVAICYDISSPEFMMCYKMAGVDLMVVPMAYDHVCWGPKFWELIGRARAFDTQVYFAEISGARNTDISKYVLYGYTHLVDPFGHIMVQAAEQEEVLHAELDFDEVKRARREITKTAHRRTDIYDRYLRK